MCQRKELNCQEQIWSRLQLELLKLGSSFGTGKFDLNLNNFARVDGCELPIQQGWIVLELLEFSES